MEEIDHAETDPKTSPSNEKKQDSNTLAQEQHPSGHGGSSKTVATWARLFQDDENMGWIENSGIGDYSYIKLLRVMEALENEDEAVAQDMDQDDEELMTTLEEWCAKFTSSL
jgi:hypothetical protein